MGHRVIVLGAALTVALLTPAAPAGAELYRWTDPEGVDRYTNHLETIPATFRAGAAVLDTPRGTAGEAEAAAAAPGGAETLMTPGGPIHASGRVNGVNVTLMVDTGADRTVVSPDALVRAGVDVNAGRPVEILGVTGGTATLEVLVPDLDVAGSALGPVAVVVHEISVPGIDGLLGRDVLDRFTLTVDTAAGRATLVPR